MIILEVFEAKHNIIKIVSKKVFLGRYIPGGYPPQNTSYYDFIIFLVVFITTSRERSESWLTIHFFES